MNDKIKKLLETAVYAPSGDNSLPWKFELRENSLKIINLPERDNPSFNYLQRGSYIAHGALIENIAKLAPVFGLEPNINILPSTENPDITAEINFRQIEPIKNDFGLTEIIKNRATNRKKFYNKEIDSKILNEILESAEPLTSGAGIIFTDDKNKIKKLSRAVSTAEWAMLNNQKLHDNFFSMVRWDTKSEEQNQFGMLIDTLELSKPQLKIFKIFSDWNKSWLFRKLYLPNLVAKENAKTYSSAPVFIAITMSRKDPENFIETGRIFQKIWLKVTELKMALQPMAGVLYLAEGIRGGSLNQVEPNIKTKILEAEDLITKTIDIPKDKSITMLFRIGSADEPSAKSRKFAPLIYEI